MIAARHWRCAKSPTGSECGKSWESIFITEYSSATKRNKIMTKTTTQINLKKLCWLNKLDVLVSSESLYASPEWKKLICQDREQNWSSQGAGETELRKTCHVGARGIFSLVMVVVVG